MLPIFFSSFFGLRFFFLRLTGIADANCGVEGTEAPVALCALQPAGFSWPSSLPFRFFFFLVFAFSLLSRLFLPLAPQFCFHFLCVVRFLPFRNSPRVSSFHVRLCVCVRTMLNFSSTFLFFFDSCWFFFVVSTSVCPSNLSLSLSLSLSVRFPPVRDAGFLFYCSAASFFPFSNLISHCVLFVFLFVFSLFCFVLSPFPLCCHVVHFARPLVDFIFGAQSRKLHPTTSVQRPRPNPLERRSRRPSPISRLERHRHNAQKTHQGTLSFCMYIERCQMVLAAAMPLGRKGTLFCFFRSWVLCVSFSRRAGDVFDMKMNIRVPRVCAGVFVVCASSGKVSVQSVLSSSFVLKTRRKTTNPHQTRTKNPNDGENDKAHSALRRASLREVLLGPSTQISTGPVCLPFALTFFHLVSSIFFFALPSRPINGRAHCSCIGVRCATIDRESRAHSCNTPHFLLL